MWISTRLKKVKVKWYAYAYHLLRGNLYRNMKKLYIIAVLIISLVFLIFFYFGFNKSSDEKNASMNLFEHYKSECKIFDAEDNESRIYKNELFGFSFTYPENSLICERGVKNHAEDNVKPEMEIAIWSKTNFFNNKMSSPELIVYINNPDLSLLPASEIISSEQIEISGIKTDKKLQKSSFCTTEDCPTFTSINLVHQGNNIEIQSWVDSQSILDSFKLN